MNREETVAALRKLVDERVPKAEERKERYAQIDEAMKIWDTVENLDSSLVALVFANACLTRLENTRDIIDLASAAGHVHHAFEGRLIELAAMLAAEKVV